MGNPSIQPGEASALQPAPQVLDAFAKVGGISFLAELKGDELQRLLISAETLEIKAGSPVSRRESPGQVFVLSEGEIGRYRKGSLEQRIDTVAPGGALELEAVFQNRSEWKYDWIAETDSTLLRVEFALLLQVLEPLPQLRSYLERIICNPELQKFRNDLRIFGLPESYLLPTLDCLTKVPAQDFATNWVDDNGFVIVHRGELSVRIVGTQGTQDARALRHFRKGDYLIWDPNHADLEIQSTPGTELWWMPFNRWARAVRSTKITFFLKLADPIGDRSRATAPAENTESQKASAPALPVRPPEIPPPGISDPEPEEFVCSPEELKRIHARKPVLLLQHDTMDCGAACLASIARFHGRKISIPVFRKLINVTREGSSLYALKTACEKVGLRALGMRLDYAELQTLRPPFIALSHYHFVVVYKVGKDSVQIGDPGSGVITIPREQFERHWTGFVLAIKPTPALHQFPESKDALSKYTKLFEAFKVPLFEIGLSSILIFFLGLATPFFMQLILDSIIPSQRLRTLHWVSIAVLGISLGAAATQWVRAYLVAHLAARMDAQFTSLFVRHVFSLPLSFFSVRRVGDITSRFLDLSWIRQAFTHHSVELLIGAVAAVAYLVVISLYSWKLAIPVVLLTTGLILVLSRMFKKLTLLMMQLSEAIGKDQSLVYDQFNSLDTIKALNATVSARWRWEANRSDMLVLRNRYQSLVAVITSMSEFFRDAVVISTLLLATYLYLAQELSLGQVVAVNAMVASIAMPLVTMIDRWDELSQLTVSLQRIDDVFSSPSEARTREEGAPTVAARGDIEFHGVSFGYSGEPSEDILKNVNFRIPAGQSVAFVGRSGSGKSTLAYMLNLLYPPRLGKITIGGVDISQASLDSLRSQVGMVIQENSIFSGMILENIAVGDRHPSLDHVIAAAKMADAHEFISRLPEGYSTVLGEGGVGLSGGQKQKINLARALYRNPAILILDEATSALDAISEDTIVRNLQRHPARPTMVLIAHRLNTIMHADRIVVLDEGRIVETGTHRELLERQGYYHSLFKDQIAL